MESLGQIAFLELNPAHGIRMNWLKYQYNYCVAKLKMIKEETKEQQVLLDKCALLYQYIQEQELELQRNQYSVPKGVPSSTCD